jgi:hypothetical protein
MGNQCMCPASNNISKKQTRYKIDIYTGKYNFSSFSGIMDCTLIGSNGLKRKFILNNSPLHYYQDNEKSTFYQDSDNLENIENVIIEITNFDIGGWFLKKIMIQNTIDCKMYEFPCCEWLCNESITLSDDKTNLINCSTRSVIQNMQKLYRWVNKCAYLNKVNIPDDKLKFSEKFTADKLQNIMTLLVEYKANSLMSNIEFKFLNWNNLDSFKHVFTVLTIPDKNVGLITDADFTDQFTNGINPYCIKLCQKFPDDVNIKNDHVHRFLEGQTLDECIENKKIYIADYSILKDITCNPNMYCSDPYCLFYLNKNNKLVPIAIQLGSTNKLVWTSDDAYYDWVYAKMWVKMADFTIHQVHKHLYDSHLVSECIYIAMLRNFDTHHPVYKLLKPYFYGLMSINNFARKTLLASGGYFDRITSIGSQGVNELLRRIFLNSRYQDMNFIKDIDGRGLGDAGQFPDYRFRDDGLLLWNAIQKYVGKIIEYLYPDNLAVANDICLYGWIDDLRKNVFHKNYGLPEKIDCRDTLVELLVCIIFTCTVKHTVLNYDQYKYFTYVPNYPGSMWRPPSTEKGITEKIIMNTLPRLDSVLDTIGLFKILATPGPEDIYLGDRYMFLFTEPQILEYLQEFNKDLEKIKEEINTRNQSSGIDGIKTNYTTLLPERIENSINI